jgi:rhamnulose-1-phosphate aldolase/alcohol dehydrogenase
VNARPYVGAEAGATTLDQLVYRSRLIGSEPALVVHGGGNTSSKTVAADHLGNERRVLLIKGSGSDLASVTRSSFAHLYLDEMLALADREAMTDEEMVAYLRHCVAEPDAPRPSIETLLHAFLPAAHVDHVHADSICALTNGRDGDEAIRAALGPDVAVVPWLRPGFELSKRVSELRDAEAVVLVHHGLVTWGDTPEESYDRTLDLSQRAAAYLSRRRQQPRPATVPTLDEPEAERLLLRLRGRLSRAGRQVLHLDPEGRRFSDRPDLDELVAAGPATADHVLRIGIAPAIVSSPAEVDDAIDAAERRYREYWDRNRERCPDDVEMRSPLPAVTMVPGLGTVTRGADASAARVVAEVAARTHAVATEVLDANGGPDPLPEHDLFDIDYWPLELVKLAGRGAPPELSGHVVIVTGAASGIGRGVALDLASRGAQLVLADRDDAGLDACAAEVAAAGSPPVTQCVDLADPAAARAVVRQAIWEFGGVDGAVLNAGISMAGTLRELSDAQWQESMEVNVNAAFRLTRELLEAMTEQGLGGSLVYVASKNAFNPGSGFGAYSAAKAALVQLARIAAIEGGPTGVRANAVNPDAIFAGSRLWSPELRAERAKHHGVEVEELEGFYAARNLLGVEIGASDVAEAVAFLLSDRSSRTTGCVMTVDGGVTAAFPR